MLKIFNRHGNGYFDVLASFIGGLVKNREFEGGMFHTWTHEHALKRGNSWTQCFSFRVFVHYCRPHHPKNMPNSRK